MLLSCYSRSRLDSATHEEQYSMYSRGSGARAHDKTPHASSLHSACLARLLQDGIVERDILCWPASTKYTFRRLARVRPERVKRQKQNKDLYRAFYAKPTSIAHGASPFCSDTCRSQDKPSLCPAFVCAPTMGGYSSVICSLAGRQEHSRNGEACK